MANIHRQEKEQFRILFQQENLKDFEQRFKILEAFLSTDRHITGNDLAFLLKKRGYAMSVGFVLDTLELMCRYGFAKKRTFDDGATRYEHHHLGQHHDHMVCTKCGQIIEFQDQSLESLQNKIAEAYGFHLLQHKMELYGICSDCQKSRSEVIPLAHAKHGERLEIQSITGGRIAQKRLFNIGLRIGDQIEIISNSGRGRLVVGADCKRFVIGPGISRHIQAHTIKGGDILQECNDEQVEGQTLAPIPLDQIDQGKFATIVRIGGKRSFSKKLSQDGITEGVEVFVKINDPLENRLVLRVQNREIPVRLSDAQQIIVDWIR